MHDIIKKALDEALTEKYYAELMESAETGHTFSVGFIGDMKALIRKTDNKLIYYSKYIAVAACAVVAIGCAVLLPNLIEGDIEVEPPVTGTSASVTSVTTDNAITDSSVTSVSSKGTSDTEETIITSVSSDESEISENSTVTSDTKTVLPPEDEALDADIPEDDDEEDDTPVIDSGDSGDKPDTDEEDDVPDDEDVEGEVEVEVDIVEEEEEEIVEEEAEEEIEAEEEEEEIADEEEDVGTDSDDDVVYEDDEDIIDNDDSVIDGDEVIDEEEDAEDEEEVEDEEEDVEEEEEEDEDVSTIPTSTLGETIAFFMWNDKSIDIENRLYTRYVYGIGVENDGTQYEKFTLQSATSNLDFIVDYLEDQKNAPIITDEKPVLNGDYVRIIISDADTLDYSFSDFSARNHYNYYFGDGTEEEEVVEEEDILGNEMSVVVCESGFAMIERFGYETTYFDVDDVKTAQLFEKFDSITLPIESFTVGYLINALDISAGNIYRGYYSVHNLYDISFNCAFIDTANEKSELASFLNKLSDKALVSAHNKIDKLKMVNAAFGFNNNTAELNIYAYDYKLYFSIGEKYYSTDISQAEFEEFIEIACRAGNVVEPMFYGTVGEYLDAVSDFNSIDYFEISRYQGNTITRYRISDTAVLEQLYALIAAELPTAVYDPFYGVMSGSYSERNLSVYLKISQNTSMYIYDNDTMVILNNTFIASDDFYDRLMDFIENNAEIITEETESPDHGNDEEEEIEEEEDVEIEEVEDEEEEIEE